MKSLKAYNQEHASASASKLRFLLRAAECFFTTWALMKASRMEPGNILTLVFFLLNFVFFGSVDSVTAKNRPDSQKKSSLAGAVLAALFTVLYMAVDYTYYIQTLTSPLFRLGILCSVFLGFFLLFFHILKLAFFYTTDKERLKKL